MKHSFSLVIAFAVITGTCGGLFAGSASAAGPDVFVTNSASHPIPVSPQGTTNISGSVNAVQSGAWSVDITGNADEPGRNPFELTLEFSANPPNSACRAIPTSPQVCDFDLPAVPAGQRLVITNITGLVFVDSPGVLGRIQFIFGPTVGSTLLGTYFNTGTGGIENMIGINARVLWFFEANTFPRIRINASAPVAIDNNGTVTSSITLSGYLVNL
jgi:hypothetical protein